MAELKKSLGYSTIVALILTAMVGTGMFLGTSIGAAYSGNAVLLAWIILIMLSVYVAACFGELIAMFPNAGGVYEFSKQAYGNFTSFMVGWVAWIMSNVATTVLVVAALDYMLPPTLSDPMRMGIAIGLIIILNLIAYIGVDFSAAILILFAVETVILFISIILPGAFFVDIQNFTPFFTSPWTMIFVSLFFMAESLMGWETASFLAEETKDAPRVIPKALIITTFLAGLLGIATAFISLGIIRWEALVNLSTPINNISYIVLGRTGTRIIGLGIALAFLGSVLGSIISTPRLLLAMARDKVFISQLAAIHPKRKTPHKAIFFQMIVTIGLLFIAFGNYKTLLAIFTPLALLLYISVLLAVPILRKKLPQARREFRVPFGRTGPYLISFMYLTIVVAWLALEPGAFTILKLIASIVGIGIPIYLLMVFFHNPDAIMNIMNRFSRVSFMLENFLLPKKIRKKMIAFTGDIKEKTVLDYGAGVGTLTLQIAEAVGPDGIVYATDISSHNVRMLKNRLARRGIEHVTVMHDEHQVNRVHPEIRNVDIIFSVGVMSYMQDARKILKEMNHILPDSGKVCFVEYVNFFKMLPDKEWLSDQAQLCQLFRECGFAVKIEKKKGLLWNYLFIYAIKSDRDIPII